jgi:hypothetical protein
LAVVTSIEPTVWGDVDADLAPAIAELRGGGEVAELAERARNYALRCAALLRARGA